MTKTIQRYASINKDRERGPAKAWAEGAAPVRRRARRCPCGCERLTNTRISQSRTQ